MIHEMKNACEILVWKLEGRARCDDNIEMYVQEKKCQDADWIQLAPDRIRSGGLF